MTISATSGWVDRTVNCIVTPSASANFERTKISAPPRNIPEKIIKANKEIKINSWGDRKIKSIK